MGVQCLVRVWLFRNLCHSSFVSILMGKKELVAYVSVLLVSCDCQCSVALPQCVMRLSAACGCELFPPGSTQVAKIRTLLRGKTMHVSLGSKCQSSKCNVYCKRTAARES